MLGAPSSCHQLRAILRAAPRTRSAMLPMVTTLGEVRAVRVLLDEARAATGIAPLELGIMVEVPAAALTAARLAPHVDFFSLGTNDLTQYTLAAERGDERLAALLAGPQPAVLRLVRATVEAAQAHGRWVGVCGELAGDPAAAVLLAGLGVTELSMAPAPDRGGQGGAARGRPRRRPRGGGRGARRRGRRRRAPARAGPALSALSG